MSTGSRRAARTGLQRVVSKWSELGSHVVGEKTNKKFRVGSDRFMDAGDR